MQNRKAAPSTTHLSAAQPANLTDSQNLMILFQAEIEEHQTLAEHYRELAAQREALAVGLLVVQEQADSDLSSLRLLVDKCKEVAPNAIASLKSAVLNLFENGDNGSDGGNQPTDPTPEPDDDGPELLCLNGETGEALTTADLDADYSTHPHKAELNGQAYEWSSPFASHLACLLWEDVPLTGQSCEWASSFASPVNFDETKYPEILKTGSRFWFGAPGNAGTVLEFLGGVEYRVQIDGAVGEVELDRHQLHYISTNLEGQCCDIDKAPLTGQRNTITPGVTEDNENKSTKGEDMPQPSSTEMVHTSARTGYLKLKTSGQILAAYAWFPRKDLAESWFDWLDGMSLGLPELRLSQRNSSWKYEIKLTGLSMVQIERLSQEDLGRKPSKKKETPAQAAGIEPPSGWRQPQQPEVQVTALTHKKARITLESSPYNGHVCDVVEANDNWWTLATPKGNLKYPADSVEPVDDAVPMAQNRQEAEAIEFEFGDIAQVVADLNDTHLVGSFGKVKFVKDGRVALEIDEQVVQFLPSELKLKAKVEIPKEQQQLQSGQVLTGNRVVTTGNYFGAARRTAIANVRRGTADKIAALELVKAGLSPDLAMAAATGTSDDASDF